MNTASNNNYSEWFDRTLRAVDPLHFYQHNFDKGIFKNSNNRIAIGYIPSGLINRLWTAVERCDDVTDETFPLIDIRNLFGWGYTLQSVAQEYMRTPGHITSIEETFLNNATFQTGGQIRDFFLRYPNFDEIVHDRAVCDSTVRLMHLLWTLRGFAQQCDLRIEDYCIRQQIQTAAERMELHGHFGLSDLY
jgi:hypothetical protein